MNPAIAWWREREDRERVILGSVAALAALALLVAFAWLPLDRSRARDATAIPGLEAGLATMKRQAVEVARLRTLPAATPATAAPLPALAASGAIARNLPGSRVEPVDEKRLRLTVPDAGYGALLEAIAAAAPQGLAVESARIEALPARGRVRAEITLARP